MLMPLFFVFGMLTYRIYHETFEKRGSEAGVRGLAFFFGIAFIIEVLIILRSASTSARCTAPYIGKAWRIGECASRSGCWSPSRWRSC